MKKAIFFDRDGVLNRNDTHVNKPAQLVLYDGVKEAMKTACNAGFDLFVVTNQGGIELGHLKEKDLKEIHNCLEAQLEGYCKIKEIVHCPDFKKPSKCRKPEPGMILYLAEKYNVDLENSWMIGDRDTDITAGLKAGCKTAKIGKVDKRANINEKAIKSAEKEVDLEAIINKIIEKHI
ncbi:HAD-IIIA family hydrolase [Serpentinicella sp. ANB-PHB4]|uniref:D-glycero-alpha-D-manno-heptose-1,7-bisphosphate 7-phosphatase n=1 Tax=Serpentinicella sp. ANB-PHB4 TaxID=3074076 RepID=UPI00285AF7E0|nr:HAD-IIIA family hydrolase [Serpentinicella sp. ANB-PHB4]MDR5658700.1 HAD-IIIA family hydrolase [Serpentinicella sp. ANB-PHB4]